MTVANQYLKDNKVELIFNVFYFLFVVLKISKNLGNVSLSYSPLAR